MGAGAWVRLSEPADMITDGPTGGTSLDSRGISPRVECHRIILANRETRRFLGVACGSWRCEVCAKRRRRQVMRRLSMGLEGGQHPRFLTLTSPAGDTPEASLRLMSRRFEKLRRLVRRVGYRGEFEFGGVVELTKRGIAHFHVLFRGPYLTQATWSRIAVEAGFGEVVWIERATSDRLAGYVTKALPGYVTKALREPKAFPRHFRRVRFSRGWAPAWVVRRPRPSADESPWELVRPGTHAMSVYQRALVLGNRADPDGWVAEDARGDP
jgi:hypothetical protein